MRCKYLGTVYECRVAESDGALNCCNNEPCQYKAGDIIFTLDNPLKPGETCESAVTKTIFDTVFEVML